MSHATHCSSRDRPRSWAPQDDRVPPRPWRNTTGGPSGRAWPASRHASPDPRRSTNEPGGVASSVSSPMETDAQVLDAVDEVRLDEFGLAHVVEVEVAVQDLVDQLGDFELRE